MSSIIVLTLFLWKWCSACDIHFNVYEIYSWLWRVVTDLTQVEESVGNAHAVVANTHQHLTMLYLTPEKVTLQKDLISLFCHVGPVHWLWGSRAAVVLATWDGPRHKSLDQSAALSHAVTPLPVWLLLVQHVFLCSSLCFHVSSEIYWVKITYALFDHCCHHGTVLKKKKWEKLWSLLAITCKKKIQCYY